MGCWGQPKGYITAPASTACTGPPDGGDGALSSCSNHVALVTYHNREALALLEVNMKIRQGGAVQFLFALSLSSAPPRPVRTLAPTHRTLGRILAIVVAASLLEVSTIGRDYVGPTQQVVHFCPRKSLNNPKNKTTTRVEHTSIGGPLLRSFGRCTCVPCASEHRLLMVRALCALQVAKLGSPALVLLTSGPS